MKLNPEEADHIAIVDWFHYKYPNLYWDFHHFANERKCSLAYGAKLKRMGVKRGVSDFFLALPRKEYSGLWIELKVGRGKLTREQIAFLHQKNKRGYLALAVWGFDAAKKIIDKYLND